MYNHSLVWTYTVELVQLVGFCLMWHPVIMDSFEFLVPTHRFLQINLHTTDTRGHHRKELPGAFDGDALGFHPQTKELELSSKQF